MRVKSPLKLENKSFTAWSRVWRLKFIQQQWVLLLNSVLNWRNVYLFRPDRDSIFALIWSEYFFSPSPLFPVFFIQPVPWQCPHVCVFVCCFYPYCILKGWGMKISSLSDDHDDDTYYNDIKPKLQQWI